MERHYSVAIDGPSGAGKSTIARAAAQRFGFLYVDTGAIYRTVGLAAERRGIAYGDSAAVGALLGGLDIRLGHGEDGVQREFLGGEDVSGLIRTPEISRRASDVSAMPAVRAFLLDMQRSLGRSMSVIMDGRDSRALRVVLPDADVKIFLTASAECRAGRRFRELAAKGIDMGFDEVLREIVARDEHDSSRAAAPLTVAEGASRHRHERTHARGEHRGRLHSDFGEAGGKTVTDTREQVQKDTGGSERARRWFNVVYSVVVPIVKLIYPIPRRRPGEHPGRRGGRLREPLQPARPGHSRRGLQAQELYALHRQGRAQGRLHTRQAPGALRRDIRQARHRRHRRDAQHDALPQERREDIHLPRGHPQRGGQHGRREDRRRPPREQALRAHRPRCISRGASASSRAWTSS